MVEQVYILERKIETLVCGRTISTGSATPVALRAPSVALPGPEMMKKSLDNYKNRMYCNDVTIQYNIENSGLLRIAAINVQS